MSMNIAVRLLFFSTVALLVLKKKETKDVPYFREQTWSAKDILLTYLIFSLVPLVAFLLYVYVPIKLYYSVVGLIFTLLAGLVLFLTIRTVIIKKNQLSINVIGIRSKDIYVYFISVLVIYIIVVSQILTINLSKDQFSSPSLLLYSFIILAVWPIIEDVFYIGMMFIPTARITGLIIGVILVSLSKSLAHFHHGLIAIFVNFIIASLSCYLYIKFKRILLPILLHILMNFMILLRDIT